MYNWPRAPVVYRTSRCLRHAETEVRRYPAERRAVARTDAVHWGAPGSYLARMNPANTASCHVNNAMTQWSAQRSFTSVTAPVLCTADERLYPSNLNIAQSVNVSHSFLGKTENIQTCTTAERPIYRQTTIQAAIIVIYNYSMPPESWYYFCRRMNGRCVCSCIPVRSCVFVGYCLCLFST